MILFPDLLMSYLKLISFAEKERLEASSQLEGFNQNASEEREALKKIIIDSGERIEEQRLQASSQLEDLKKDVKDLKTAVEKETAEKNVLIAKAIEEMNKFEQNLQDTSDLAIVKSAVGELKLKYSNYCTF